ASSRASRCGKWRHGSNSTAASSTSGSTAWTSTCNASRRERPTMGQETMTKTDAAALTRELLLGRTFDAPRELVFKAWTDPKHLAQWWGPLGFTNPVCEADARPGGKWRIVMRGPDGGDFPHGGEYLEVTPYERIVMTNALEGDFHPFGP